MRNKRIEKILDEMKLQGINKVAMSPVDCSKSGEDIYSLRKRDFCCWQRIIESIFEKTIRAEKKAFHDSIITPHLNLIDDMLKGKSKARLRWGAFYGMIAVATNGSINPPSSEICASQKRYDEHAIYRIAKYRFGYPATQ